MLFYLAGPRIGAMGYNTVHSTLAAFALGAIGLATGLAWPVAGALILFAHIGFDRMRRLRPQIRQRLRRHPSRPQGRAALTTTCVPAHPPLGRCFRPRLADLPSDRGRLTHPSASSRGKPSARLGWPSCSRSAGCRDERRNVLRYRGGDAGSDHRAPLREAGIRPYAWRIFCEQNQGRTPREIGRKVRAYGGNRYPAPRSGRSQHPALCQSEPPLA